MLIDKEKIEEAKEILGDRNFEIMMDCYGVQDYDHRNMKCSCPFHFPDKTPSFVYNKSKYYGHCFSCGKTVDVLDAFMATGDTYLEACQELFEMADMKVPLGEMHVRTKTDYKYPYEPQKDTRDVVNGYFKLRGISERILDYCDVREDNGNVAFLYYDTNDVLTMVKYKLPRKPDKSRGEMKSWCQKGASTTPLLFNMNRVNTSMPLLITEGEPDCLAAIECGYTNTVSVPFGAGSNNTWIRENFEWLEQFPTIIIAFDNDAAGIEGTKDALYRLGSWKTKVMQIPESYTKEDGALVRIKDINEMYFFMGAEAVLEAIINAKDTPVPSVEQFYDIEETALYDMDGVETGIDQLDDELIKLFYGTLTIISGRPGCVDAETEYFNGRTWKSIAKYRKGEQVLQYNPTTRDASLVKPEAYIKEKCDSFIHLTTRNGLDQCVSPEHQMVVVVNGRTLKVNIWEFLSLYNNKDLRLRFIAECDSFGGIMNDSGRVNLSCISFERRRLNKITVTHLKSKDGYKYCFTVPSGMLVLRRKGKVNVTGNSGKSSFVNQLIANTIDAGVPAFLYSQEMNNQMLSNWANLTIAGSSYIDEKVNPKGRKYYIVPRKIKEQIKEWTKDKLYIYKDDQPNDVESVIKSMEACVRKYNTRLIILDNLMMLDLKCSETDKNTAQTNLVNDLIQFAKKYNVAIILVAHPKKTAEMSSDIGMYDISGSSNIINLAMRSIGLRRVSKREKEDDRNEFCNFDVVLTIMKDRMLGRSDVQIGLHYDIKSRRFYTNYEEYARDYGWDEFAGNKKLELPECLKPRESEVFGEMRV